MEEIFNYLKKCGTFYIATTDGDQPRVRPFGAVTEFEGKIYIVTNNKKKVYHQMVANSKVEISATCEGTWLRLESKAIPDDNKAVREKILTDYPSLCNLYSADDGLMEVLYLEGATATIYSFTAEPKVVKF